MKITKTSLQSKQFEENKRKANIGCEKCPECGKYPNHLPICTMWAKLTLRGFINMKKDFYYCECGCHWESEPYRWS